MKTKTNVKAGIIDGEISGDEDLVIQGTVKGKVLV